MYGAVIVQAAVIDEHIGLDVVELIGKNRPGPVKTSGGIIPDNGNVKLGEQIQDRLQQVFFCDGGVT